MTALHFYVTVQRIFSHWPSAGTQALCRYFGKGPFPPRGACRSCVGLIMSSAPLSLPYTIIVIKIHMSTSNLQFVRPCVTIYV